MTRAINRAYVRSLSGRISSPSVPTAPALPRNNNRNTAIAFLGFLGFLGASGKGVENRPPFALLRARIGKGDTPGMVGGGVCHV